MLSQIRDLGKKARVVLDPATPVEFIQYVLHPCDIVLVMTVNPGFAGQEFLPEILPRIRGLRQLCRERGLAPINEVNGGQNCANARSAVAAGTNAIVAGSAIFDADDYTAATAASRNGCYPPNERMAQ